MQTKLLFGVAMLVAAASLQAQTVTYIAPNGLQTSEGNTNNTIPWWSQSGTYQQIHDASDLSNVLPGGVGVIKGISFRKDGVSTTVPAARTMDVEISLGTTAVTAAGATTTFATNIGATPLVVLPYTNVSLPALSNVSLPNPQGWAFPFSVPYPYAAASGNLCVEIRFKNNSVITSAPLDASSGTTSTFPAVLNTGCLATGQTTASALTRSMTLSTGTWTNGLTRGAASAAAVLVIGAVPQSFNLGFCTTLETIPVATVNGTTGTTGSLSIPLVAGSLIGQPSVTLYSQYAWLDAGLAGGLGLSPCGATITPNPNLASVSRIYAAPSSGGAGNETALTGTTGLYFGLVLGLDV